MEPNFKPFTLVASMRSPVVITAHAPTLDALVYEAVSQHRCELQTHAELIEATKALIAFDEAMGVFRASSMHFVVEDATGIVTQTVSRVDMRTPEKMSSEMFVHRLPGGKIKKGKINVKGGPTKIRLNQSCAYSAPYVAFSAVGDSQVIRDLLLFYGIGVGYDATNCGNGAIEDIFIYAQDEDTSFSFEGLPNRPLPVRANDQFKTESPIRSSALLPPYYPQFSQLAIAPERFRVQSINNLI